MKFISEKIKKQSEQCSLCQAQFEIQLNNARLPEEKKEKIIRHILKYCPVCVKVDQKY
jgi:hypothetical protein